MKFNTAEPHIDPNCCDKFRDPKQLEEERAYLFHLQLTVHHPRKSEQELKELKQDHNKATLFTGLLSLLSGTTQDHLPMCASAHNGLSPPISITNQEVSPQSFLQATLMETILQMRFPFPILQFVSS